MSLWLSSVNIPMFSLVMYKTYALCRSSVRRLFLQPDRFKKWQELFFFPLEIALVNVVLYTELWNF